MMSVIHTEDIAWLGLTTVLAACLLARQARLVGISREKFKINPPTLVGPDEFMRTFRAHQNFVEMFGVFLSALWVAGIFFHQVSASVVGFIYLYFRYKYFWGYVESARKRWKPFWRSITCLCVLVGMAIVGALGTITGILK